jgi:uncharacterized glyoxalase superfamily protein PhnB
MPVKKRARKAPARRAAAAKKTSPRPAKARAGLETLKLSEASPGFTVNDLEKSLAWYTDVLGFQIDERWMTDGKLVGVSLQAGGVTFMIGQDDWKKGRDRRKGEGFRLYCETSQDVDALARRIQARGGVLDHEPRDEPWGMRDFALTDPDGFKLTIGANTK